MADGSYDALYVVSINQFWQGRLKPNDPAIAHDRDPDLIEVQGMYDALDSGT
jgi:hypothetical protein